MSKNNNSETSVYEKVVDISKTIQIPMPFGATSISVVSELPTTTSGIIKVEGSINSDSCLSTSQGTGGALTTVNGTLSSAGIYIGSKVINGKFSVASNILSFLPTNSISVLQDTPITAILKTIVAGSVQTDRSIMFSQSSSSGINKISLGVVSQTTGADTVGDAVIHNMGSLVLPQSFTFMISSFGAGKVSLKSGIPLLAYNKSLLEEGYLRMRVELSKSTALNKASIPKNKSASILLDILSIDTSTGIIIVDNSDNILNNSVGSTFNGIMMSQGPLVPHIANFSNDTYGISSVTLKANIVTSSTKRAIINIVRANSLSF